MAANSEPASKFHFDTPGRLQFGSCLADKNSVNNIHSRALVLDTINRISGLPTPYSLLLTPYCLLPTAY